VCQGWPRSGCCDWLWSMARSLVHLDFWISAYGEWMVCVEVDRGTSGSRQSMKIAHSAEVLFSFWQTPSAQPMLHRVRRVCEVAILKIGGDTTAHITYRLAVGFLLFLPVWTLFLFKPCHFPSPRKQWHGILIPVPPSPVTVYMHTLQFSHCARIVL
jgi:hypothetical protein